MFRHKHQHMSTQAHTYHRHNTRTTAIIKHLPQYRVSLCTCVIRKTEKLYFFFSHFSFQPWTSWSLGDKKKRERWTWSKHLNHNKIRLFQGPRSPPSLSPHCFFPPSLSLLCLVFVCVAIVSNWPTICPNNSSGGIKHCPGPSNMFDLFKNDAMAKRDTPRPRSPVGIEDQMRSDPWQRRNNSTNSSFFFFDFAGWEKGGSPCLSDSPVCKYQLFCVPCALCLCLEIARVQLTRRNKDRAR